MKISFKYVKHFQKKYIHYASIKELYYLKNKHHLGINNKQSTDFIIFHSLNDTTKYTDYLTTHLDPDKHQDFEYCINLIQSAN